MQGEEAMGSGGLPRLRFAKDAAKELKKLDPETRISAAQIRRLMKSGKVPVVPVCEGRQMLVNLDRLIEYYQNLDAATAEPDTAKGTVRPLPERM